MKTFINYLLLLAALFAASCSLDDLNSGDAAEGEDVGYLTVSNVNYNSDAEEIALTTRAQSKADDTYYIQVFEKYTGTEAWSGTYADLKEGSQLKSITLTPGTYYATARQTQSGIISGVAVDSPYYSGTSADFAITKKNTTSVSINCYLANIITTVELSADLKKIFKSLPDNDADRLKTTVSVGLGEEVNSYVYEASSTHTTPFVYFKDVAGQDAQDGNTMTIVLSGKYYTGYVEDIGTSNEDSSLYKTVSMTKTLTNVRAKQWRKISIDVDHNTSGNVQFVITIESYTFDEEIAVDVMTLYSNLNTEEAIDDPEEGGSEEEEEDSNAPSVSFDGGTTSFSISSADWDETSEEFTKSLIATIMPEGTSTLASAYAVVSSDNSEFMTNLASKISMPDNNVALYPTNAMSSYLNMTTSGTSVQYKAKRSALTELVKYTGNHKFSVYTEDNQGRKKHTDLTITVGGGSSEGLGVDWYAGTGSELSKTNKITLEYGASSAVECKITADNGLAGLVVYITSDVLDKATLESIGLAQTMDLFNPSSAAMESALRGLGFLPMEEGKEAGDDDNYRIYDPETGEKKSGAVSPYKDQTSVDFSITAFIPLLSSLAQDGSDNTFTVSIKDNISAEASGSMRIICNAEK